MILIDFFKGSHIRNAIFGLFSFLIPTIVVFLSYKLILSSLGDVEFGAYVIITSIGGAMSFMDMGVSMANVKFIANDINDSEKRKNIPSIIWTSVAFYALIGFFVLILMFFFASILFKLFKLPENLIDIAPLLFLLAALQIFFALICNVFIGGLKAFGRFDLSMLASLPVSTFGFGAGAIGVYFGFFGLKGLMYCSILGSVVSIFFGFFVLRYLCKINEIDIFQGKASFNDFKRMFGFGSVMTIHIFVGIFFNQIQRLLVGWSLGPQAVTTFHVTHTFFAKIHALINSFSEFLYPAVSSSKCIEKTRKIYLKVFLAVNVISFFSLSVVFFVSKYIFIFWLGEDMSNNIEPLLVPFLIAFYFIIASIPTFHLLNGLGLPKINVYYSLSNILIYLIVLIFYAGSEMEIYNFAMAFMISNMISGILFQLILEFLVWPKIRNNMANISCL